MRKFEPTAAQLGAAAEKIGGAIQSYRQGKSAAFAFPGEIMKFETLDPRNTPEAAAANDAVFASGPVLGIEVTIPALAARCSLGNIDPQHSGGNADLAAIEAAERADLVIWEESLHDAALVTVRADLDSVGAMAVFALRVDRQFPGKYPPEDQAIRDRIQLVANADKFARGPWPGPQPLPSTKNPWPASAAGASDTRALAAIAAAVMDHKIPLARRVEWMKRWLLTGEEPARYREQVEAERAEMIRALEVGEIKIISTFSDEDSLPQHSSGRTVSPIVVESTHRAATMIGYCLAPVVVALNPQFRLNGGEPQRIADHHRVPARNRIHCGNCGCGRGGEGSAAFMKRHEITVPILTSAQRQALFCNSDWRLPEGFDMIAARAAFERQALADARLPVSEIQFSHRGSGTIVVSFKEPDAEAKLTAIRERFADTPGADDVGNDALGADIFVVRPGETKWGDDLGWVILNSDVILCMCCTEMDHITGVVEWAVVARFDPHTDEPLTDEETVVLKAAIRKANTVRRNKAEAGKRLGGATRRKPRKRKAK